MFPPKQFSKTFVNKTCFMNMNCRLNFSFSNHSEKHNVKVRSFILDILSAIIQESESLSQAILDTILSNLVDQRKVCMLLIVSIH